MAITVYAARAVNEIVAVLVVVAVPATHAKAYGMSWEPWKT